MEIRTIILAGLGSLALAGCASTQEEEVAAAPPPGAVAGSTAADRDGDGIVDGYYTSDGMYHPNLPPAPPPPLEGPSPMGERG